MSNALSKKERRRLDAKARAKRSKAKVEEKRRLAEQKDKEVQQFLTDNGWELVSQPSFYLSNKTPRTLARKGHYFPSREQHVPATWRKPNWKEGSEGYRFATQAEAYKIQLGLSATPE